MKPRFGLYIRIVLAIGVAILISVAINYWDNKWISAAYTLILALFPNEIKDLIFKPHIGQRT